MTIHPLAAKPPPQELAIAAGNLRREYYARKPDFTGREPEHLWCGRDGRRETLEGAGKPLADQYQA